MQSLGDKKAVPAFHLWQIAAVVCLLTLAAKIPPANAQSEAVPRVAMAELGGTPGSNLMMPLYYTPDPKNPVKSIAVDIEFVSNNLKFQKALRGVGGDSVNADITTALTEGKPDDKNITRSTLHVTAALPGSTPKEGLPDGMLAYLLFQISLDAKPFAIKLTPSVVDSQDMSTPPKKIAKFGIEPGLVKVEVLDVMPENTCFFFSH
jgi:hypothetical protein